MQPNTEELSNNICFVKQVDIVQKEYAMTYNLAQIAQCIGANVIGDDTQSVTGLATLASAQAGQITFLANSKYRQQLKDTKASAVILNKADVSFCNTNTLVMDNPYVGFAKVAQLLDTTPPSAQGIHPSAVIDDSARIGNNVSIGPNSVIEAGVEIGNCTSIGACCFIGRNAVLGENSKLWSNISIYHNVRIGNNCLVQANAVIGADGFGYAKDQQEWIKIPQLGTVLIGDNVEIGASTTIDRGALDDTLIENGVILDNQIQIAHNVFIGENTAIAGCTVVAGSASIGKNCTIGGMVAINGHISIADGTYITGMSMVTKGTDKPVVLSSGIPAIENKKWHRMNARLRKLDDVFQRVSSAEKTLETLKIHPGS